MAGRRWGLALLVLGGMVVGLAVAGVPSRSQDPPLRIDPSVTSTTAALSSTSSSLPSSAPGATP